MLSTITGQGFKLFTDGSTTKIAAAAITVTAKLSPNQDLTSGVTYEESNHWG